MTQATDSHQLKMSRIKVRLCFITIVIIIFGGTIGYHLIEKWPLIDCLYMTVITLSTVGYTEVHVLSPYGRFFTMALVVCGVGTLAFSLAGMIEFIFQYQMMILATKYKNKRIITKMNNHIIICGGGKMGAMVLGQLIKEGIDNIIVIESEPAKVAVIEDYKVPIIQADAKLEKTLQEAAIDRAEALVATLDTDADNLFLVLTARDMNPALNIIARTETESNRRKFVQAGATQTVSPYFAGARNIFNLLVSPDISSLAETIAADDNVRFQVERLEIHHRDQFDGKTIARANLREVLGGLVVAIKKTTGKTVFNPPGNTQLAPGDILYVIKFSQRNQEKTSARRKDSPATSAG